jgi:hypothetical protein
MAGSGYEPPDVRAVMEFLQPICHGMSLCGAGGGGFLVVITKEPFQQNLAGGGGCWDIIHEAAKRVGGTAHTVQLVENGMEIAVEY